MEDWKEHYKQHLVSMDAVVNNVKDGDALWFGAAPEIPYAMLEKLHDRMDELHDVTLLYNVMNFPTSLVFDEEASKHFNFVSMFCLPLERMASEYGNAPFHSCPFEFIPRAVVEVYKCNTVAINVCPPDEDGYVNIGIYGVSASGLIASDPRVAKKIAIIDRNQPAAGGSRDQVCLKLTDFDYIVECDSEPQEVPGHGPTELDEKIASYVIPYIHDGDKSATADWAPRSSPVCRAATNTSTSTPRSVAKACSRWSNPVLSTRCVSVAPASARPPSISFLPRTRRSICAISRK